MEAGMPQWAYAHRSPYDAHGSPIARSFPLLKIERGCLSKIDRFRAVDRTHGAKHLGIDARWNLFDRTVGHDDQRATGRKAAHAQAADRIEERFANATNR